MLVEQKSPPQFIPLHLLQALHLLLPLTGWKMRLIGVVIMIAHDAHHSVLGLQLLQDRQQGFQFGIVARNEVACEADQIGLERIDVAHHLHQPLLLVEPSIQMPVADVYYPVTTKSLRHPPVIIAPLLHLPAEAAHPMPVGIGTPPGCQQQHTTPRKRSPCYMHMGQPPHQPAQSPHHLRNQQPEKTDHQGKQNHKTPHLSLPYYLLPSSSQDFSHLPHWAEARFLFG